ncbi:MAG: cbb3-type cytochrome oxidase assembly protein CcoS [Burkholderiales bacterium]|nr:cbb3-type cytochrome oxidase assembly protein CcoS [Burkholderiales bacterium]MDE2457054.1 cbb3-type cytochrome oxidase assembly protein CcoS [Burkholderiales bacterium]
MDILYFLVPFSALVVLSIIGVFGWAVAGGQFEDLDAEGRRILDDDQPAQSRLPEE